MFHANGWGLAFSGPASGAKLVMPGAKLDGASLYELIETEQVTFTAAVPTVWQGLLQYLGETGNKFTSLKGVLIGGAAVSESTIRAFRDDHGVEVTHAWGMTETSPLGTVSRPTDAIVALSDEEQMRFKLKQGRPPLGIELKVTAEDGQELPHDGRTFGHLKVRGPFVARAYFRGEGPILDDEGFFDTGDVATLDPHGFMQITDRSKDVIKSGGEWISSIEIENIALGHPKTALAAVIGRAHPKWDERPLMIVKLKDGETATPEEYLGFLEGKIAKWWTPDDVVFIEDIPLGATGKIDKKLLRTRFEDYVFPAVAAASGATLAEVAARSPVIHAPEPPVAEAAEAAAEDPLSAEPEPETIAATAPAEFVEAEPLEIEPAAEVVELHGETLSDQVVEELAPPPALEPTEAEAEALVESVTFDPEPEMLTEPVVEAEPEVVAPELQPEPVTEPEAPLMFAPLSPRPQPKVRPKTGNAVLALNLIIAVTLLPALLTVFGALAARFGLIDFATGYSLLTVQLTPKLALIGVAAAVVGGALAVFGPKGLWGRAVIALAIAIVTLAAIQGFRSAANAAPAHDVATDWRDPLSFSDKTMAERGDAATPVDLDPVLPVGSGPFAGRRVADVNAETCRAARPLTVPQPASDVYERVRDAARDAGLTLTQDDPTTGRLEAVATALAYGAKDDVAVRVAPVGDGARVDIRSISREQATDLGRNCRRVVGLLAKAGG
jgi:fatty-acyl-CoA synthase